MRHERAEPAIGSVRHLQANVKQLAVTGVLLAGHDTTRDTPTITAWRDPRDGRLSGPAFNDGDDGASRGPRRSWRAPRLPPPCPSWPRRRIARERRRSCQ